ncbi:MAG TPA: AmmeMemoRadiSam system radical SAM enzyme [Lachnospiraceae bacterium]|nr:AmmeMemoRadiSam system radical SAM enzyme [Lachnospiraceae bacterium]
MLRNQGCTEDQTAVCRVCPHHCRIPEGAFGRCRARKNAGGKVICANYGKLTSMALDPIEKKPLAYFLPGSMILSVGSYGCNLSCPFCQNYEISMAGESDFRILQEVSPQKLCSLAMGEAARGNVGVAYTYNEALAGYEYVRDSARLVHEAGMVNVLVTNGMAELPVLEELLPYIDAMNIDLKCFRPEIYRKLGGDLETVKAFISRAAQNCHVELTSLIVPGMNDDLADMDRQAEWIAQINPRMPLHLTRYFPRYRMHEKPTDLSLLMRLKKVAQKSLERVLLGNV